MQYCFNQPELYPEIDQTCIICGSHKHLQEFVNSYCSERFKQTSIVYVCEVCVKTRGHQRQILGKPHWQVINPLDG